jgi:hypothetical protein
MVVKPLIIMMLIGFTISGQAACEGGVNVNQANIFINNELPEPLILTDYMRAGDHWSWMSDPAPSIDSDSNDRLQINFCCLGLYDHSNPTIHLNYAIHKSQGRGDCTLSMVAHLRSCRSQEHPVIDTVRGQCQGAVVTATQSGTMVATFTIRPEMPKY